MAYRKKGAKSASRRTYRRRYTRRRRYRRKYPRRSGRRFPKGTEVKSKSVDLNGSVTPTFVEISGATNMSLVPGKFITIGGSTDNYNLQIPQGTAQGQRVGAKIEPIKLRISGSLQVDDTTLGITNPPNFWQVRCIVYQVKGGNANYNPTSSGYHPLGLNGSNGNVSAEDLRKLFCNYESTDSSTFTEDQWRRNNFFAKVPFRRGIGGTCRILYKKSFWINAQKNPIKQFRFICKTPKRLVYPENITASAGDATFNVANNAIYIVFVWQPGSFQQECIPTLHYSYHVDLFYTDK